MILCQLVQLRPSNEKNWEAVQKARTGRRVQRPDLRITNFLEYHFIGEHMTREKLLNTLLALACIWPFEIAGLDILL
jgi:hypothetical protein